MLKIEKALARWLTGPRVRAYSFTVLALWLALTAVSPWVDTSGAPSEVLPAGADFIAFRTGTELVRTGRVSHLYDQSAQHEIQESLAGHSLTVTDLFIHPPYALLFLYPICRLGYPLSYLVFVALSMLALAGTAWLLRGHLEGFRGYTALVLMGVALRFHPAFVTFGSGQLGHFLLFALSLFYCRVRQNKDLSAGWALGFLWIKPQLLIGLLIVLAVTRRWRVLLGSALAFGCWITLGEFFFPHALEQYVRFAPQLAGLVVSENYPVWGQMSFYAGGVLAFSWINADIGRFAGWALTVVAGVWLLRGSRSLGDFKTGNVESQDPITRRHLRDLHWASVLVVAVLMSPHFFFYDGTLLLLPLAIVSHVQLNRTQDAATGAWSARLGDRIRITFFWVYGTTYWGMYVAGLFWRAPVRLPVIPWAMLAVTLLAYRITQEATELANSKTS